MTHLSNMTNTENMDYHKWRFCTHCDHMVVICGKCGNNTCNAGHGTVDGNPCDACESAYELYLKPPTIIKYP
jgi:hypothetical protein